MLEYMQGTWFFCAFTQVISYLSEECQRLTWWAVLSVKAFIADASAVHTQAMTDAVVGTLLGAAVVPREVGEAHAPAVHAVPLVAAVSRTRHPAAVVPRVALVTHTLAIHTPAVVIALVGTGGHRAVEAFPPRVAHAAAGFMLVHTVATAACVQASAEKVSGCYFTASKLMISCWSLQADISSGQCLLKHRDVKQFWIVSVLELVPYGRRDQPLLHIKIKMQTKGHKGSGGKSKG